ncbi:MAG: hypothetical protein ACI8RD_012521, partial [Bacillariaceae sp.]|jgi:hypothetical protein
VSVEEVIVWKERNDGSKFLNVLSFLKEEEEEQWMTTPYSPIMNHHPPSDFTTSACTKIKKSRKITKDSSTKTWFAIVAYISRR